MCRMTEWLDQLKALSEEYHFQLEDVPDILEEYILIDNEVIENQNIKQTIQEAMENERTALGKSVLKQLLEQLE